MRENRDREPPGAGAADLEPVEGFGVASTVDFEGLGEDEGVGIGGVFGAAPAPGGLGIGGVTGAGCGGVTGAGLEDDSPGSFGRPNEYALEGGQGESGTSAP